MSVVSRNPFDLLGDDGDSSPAPAKTTPAPAAKKAEPVRSVPGSAPANRVGADRGRGGRAPARGAPRNVPRNTGPDPSSATIEGAEGADGFEGERVAPPKRAHQGPDKHTKGPRDGDATRGGPRTRGTRGSKTPAFGAERRQFERKSGGLPDSQKKIEHGWGANEGGAELSAEVQGENDAQAEEAAPGTPAEDAEATEAAPAEDAAPEEPEEIQKSYDEFLAERAAAALAFGKKESRQVTADTLEGKAFVREGIADFFSGKEEKAAPKAKTAKKEKIYIEVDGQFAAPAGSRPPRGNGEVRGGRGGARGRGEGRGRGGRGGQRGAARGAFAGSRPSANAPLVNAADEKAFPALGA